MDSMAKPLRVGVVALQGDYSLHIALLEKLNALGQAVRCPADLAEIDALIIPGGESTTLSILGDKNNLWDEVKRIAGGGLPIMGTCAGLIMLSKKIDSNSEHVLPMKILDVTVKRNAYGSQVNSFEGTVEVELDEKKLRINGVFIRAPRIVEVGKQVQVIGTLQKEPVFVRQGNIWGLTFHPELSETTVIHKEFLKLADIFRSRR